MNKNFQFGITDNTTYCGKEAQDWYSTLLLTGDTKSLIRQFPNVKSKIKVPSFDMSNLVQADGCSLSDQGTNTLAEKTLEVCNLAIHQTFCVTTFEQNYMSEMLKPGSNGSETEPQSFTDYVIKQIGLNVNAFLEDLMWTGDVDASPADLCDGLLVQFVADATVVDVSGTTLSASNIIAELAKVYAAIPATVINGGKVVIFVSTAAMKFYKQAIAALNPLGGSYTQIVEPNYLGIPLVVAPGMPADDMVAADPNNLWLGTDLVSDFEDVQVISTKPFTGNNTIIFRAAFKFGVSYGVGAEIVYYT